MKFWRLRWIYTWQFACSMLIVLSMQAFSAVPEVGKPALANTPKKILILGDSLSAAYGLPVSSGWVTHAEKQLDSKQWRVVNASISGETTAGGLQRLQAALKSHQPKLVVIELGANDGLRGLPIAQMRKNLSSMIEQSQASGAKVLLIGIRLPPNFGASYNQQFDDVFRTLQRQYATHYLANLLDPILKDRNMYQDDNLHPIAKAQPLLAQHVLAAMLPILKTVH